MQLQHIVTVLAVLLLIWFLWQKRATPDSAAPPEIDKNPDPDKKKNLDEKSDFPLPSSDASSGDSVQQAITRLMAEPGYKINQEHEDCRFLIAQGTSALQAIFAQVERDADSWVHLYPAMGAVAEGLGDAGRKTLVRLLSESIDANSTRLVSFLKYAASDMSQTLCETLCENVTLTYAEAFGAAAAHYGKKAVEIIVPKMRAAPPEQAERLQRLLARTYAEFSSEHKKEWLRALSHEEPRVRAAAVAAERLRDDRDAVLALHADPSEIVRYAFVCCGDNIPGKMFMRLIEDESTRVRAVAAWRLHGDDADAQTFERLLDDPQPSVALMAAVSLDHPSTEERLMKALASDDAELRRCGARVAGFLSGERFGEALALLEKNQHYDDLAEAIGAGPEDPAELRMVAQVALRNPPIQVLHAVEVQLAFTDDAEEFAALLLAAEAPARVRRAGFYAISAHRDAWPRFIAPLLRPDEPLLQDLIDQLESSLQGDDPIDREMFETLKQRYPGTQIEALAETALKKKD